MSLILEIVIPVFLIVLVGFMVGKYKRIDTKPFIDLIVYIAGPSLIITSMSKSDINLSDFLFISISATLVVLVSFLLVFFILKITKSEKKGLYLPMTFGNTGYLGYPICLFAYGVAGLSMAVLYDMINSLFLFSIGIWVIHRKNGLKEAFKLPLIYAVIVGLALNIFKIKIPEIIFKPMEIIGMIVIPLALLILGYKLTEIKIQTVRTAFFASLFRIIGGFIIAFLIIKLFSISGLVRNIILIEAAMPAAVMSIILTSKYSKDPELVASIVFISTLISLISIPLVLWFVAL